MPVAAATVKPAAADQAAKGLPTKQSPKERPRSRVASACNASALPSSPPRRALPSRGNRPRPLKAPPVTQAKLAPGPPPPVEEPADEHADELAEYMENLRTTEDNGEFGVLSVRRLSASNRPTDRRAGCFASATTAAPRPPPPPPPLPAPPPAFPPSSDGGGSGGSGGGGGSGGLDRQVLMREYQRGRAAQEASAAPRLTLAGVRACSQEAGVMESCVCEAAAPVRAAQLDEVRLAASGWQRSLCTQGCSLYHTGSQPPSHSAAASIS